MLTDAVRVALGRAICKRYADDHDTLWCLMLDAQLEELIATHLEHADDVVGNTLNTLPPARSQEIGRDIVACAEEAERERGGGGSGGAGGGGIVVLTAPAVRSAVKRMVEPLAAHLAVLSLAEVVPEVRPKVVAVVGENAGDNNTSSGSGDLTVEDGYESANV
jgi:flagellar biosynthesis component FlhA